MKVINRILILFIFIQVVLNVISLQQLNEQVEENFKSLTTKLESVEAENLKLKLYIFELETFEVETDLVYKEVCSTSIFKSWMDYRAITSVSSKQYKLQQRAITSPEGHRMIGEYVMVAMGPEYGPVGSKYQIFFEGGQKLNVIVGDIKHQGCTSLRDNSMIEFIVDSNAMSPLIKKLGNYNHIYQGQVIFIIQEV